MTEIQEINPDVQPSVMILSEEQYNSLRFREKILVKLNTEINEVTKEYNSLTSKQPNARTRKEEESIFRNVVTNNVLKIVRDWIIQLDSKCSEVDLGFNTKDIEDFVRDSANEGIIERNLEPHEIALVQAILTGKMMSGKAYNKGIEEAFKLAVNEIVQDTFFSTLEISEDEAN